MSTRVVKFKVQTQALPISVETDARTLGELKEVPAVKDLGIRWNEVSLIERRTKTTIELDDALLPASDCLILISPKQTKAGALSYKDARAAVIKLMKAGKIQFNLMGATTESLNKVLEENKEEVETEEFDSEVTIAVKGIKKEDVKVIDFPEESTEEIIEADNIVELVTTEDLDEELESIRKELNKK